MNEFLQFVHEMRTAYGTGGWAAGGGAFFFGAMTVYRLAPSQKFIAWLGGFLAALHPKMAWIGPLSQKLLWENWNTLAKVGVVVLLAGGAAFFTTIATGGTVWVALGAMVAALVTTMGSRKFMKMVGENPAKVVLLKIQAHDQRKLSKKVAMPNAPVIGDFDDTSDPPASDR